MSFFNKVLPGFEPGLQDSKSRVITTYTIKPKKATVGSRTLDLILTKDMLCHLSYSGKKIFIL